MKTILITGSTDGIGLAAAKSLSQLGHKVVLHGRSQGKLEAVLGELSESYPGKDIAYYQADLSVLSEVEKLAKAIKDDGLALDVMINNAGVFKVTQARTVDDLDTRFAVNTVAPYALTRMLTPALTPSARVINLASAAQAPFEPAELSELSDDDDSTVYAKSKLALIMWTRHIAQEFGKNEPMVMSVNPKSFLGSKMVKQAYGVAGSDVQIGADVLVKAALSDEFADAAGLYFDNDHERFASPHPFALDDVKAKQVVETIEAILANKQITLA